MSDPFVSETLYGLHTEERTPKWEGIFGTCTFCVNKEENVNFKSRMTQLRKIKKKKRRRSGQVSGENKYKKDKKERQNLLKEQALDGLIEDIHNRRGTEFDIS